MTRVVFVLGASGSGKTAVAREIEHRDGWADRVHYFDDIGVPTPERMESDFGGGEEWQRWATARWLADLAARDAPLQLLEGQTRPSFVVEAARDHPAIVPEIILLDAAPEVRERRLAGRGQPDLADRRMDMWAAYLRGQADALGLPVIDTSELGIAEVADRVEALL